MSQENTSAVINLKGKDIPEVLTTEIKTLPNKKYTITIRPHNNTQSLRKIISDTSKKAQARGMTPEVLKKILGKKAAHIF
jgi:hypothetical protein